MAKKAVEFWEFDWEYSYTPVNDLALYRNLWHTDVFQEQSSQVFSIVNYNTTFYQFSDQNNFVFDERGFNYFLKGEASTFLKANDSRLLLNTIVTNISYSDDAVKIYNRDGSCIKAEFAICTFS